MSLVLDLASLKCRLRKIQEREELLSSFTLKMFLISILLFETHRNYSSEVGKE